MFCTVCGTAITDGMKFCVNCGTPVANILPAKETIDAVEEVTEVAKETSEAIFNAPEIPKAETSFDVKPEEAVKETVEEVVEEVVKEAEPVQAAYVPPVPVVASDNKTYSPLEGISLGNVSAENTSAPVKKQREAFKFFSFIGVIMALVACFFDMHTFIDEAGESRVDKIYEFSYGQIIIGGLVVALILLCAKLSSFALAGIAVSVASFALFISEFYSYNWDYLNSSEAEFKFCWAFFLLCAGLVLSVIGLFVKFGKKPLFKI